MAVRILCPECDQKLNVAEEILGTTVRCPTCKVGFIAGDGGKEKPQRPGPQDERVDRRGGSGLDDDEETSTRRAKSRTPAAPQGVSVLGIISLVLGCLALPLSFIPCINFIGLPIAVIGLLLGVIGFFVSKSGQQSGTGLPIAGSAVSLVGLLISLAWIGVMALAVHTAEAKRAQEEAEIRDGPAISITAVALFNAYTANASAADAKYKDKVLELTGTIDDVIVGSGVDEPTVHLKTADEDETVDCDFAFSRRAEVAKLNPDQNVTVRGKCQGKSFGTVTLEKCILK